MKFANYMLKDIPDKIRREGRVTITDNGLLTDWSACGFSVNFSGSGVCIYFAPLNEVMPVYVLTVLDGVRSKHAVTTGRETIVLEAAPGNHTLTFLRLSEGGVALTCTELRFSSDASEPGPALLDAPEYRSRRLVFFGDSITCGYGDFGNRQSPIFMTYEEDPTRAYACRTAEQCFADAEIVSISGQGIVRNCNGDVDTPIPLFSTWQSRTLHTPCDKTMQPDAVIINAGTNDCGGRVTYEEMAEEGEKFLRRLRADYPQAKIVWFYGMMGSMYDETLRGLIEKLNPELGGLYYLHAACIAERSDEFGANGHPSIEGARRASLELSAFLCSVLGW